MKQNVTGDQIVKQLVNVFRDEAMTAEYNYPLERRQGVCGWCGVMSPLSRTAYINDFGLKMVLACEINAQAIINDDRKRYEESEYHSHEIEADEHKAIDQPAPQEGSFMWAMHSGLKCDGRHGIYDELRYKLYDTERQHVVLVNIEKVYHVTEEEFKNPDTADKVACSEDCPGGWHEEDGDFLDAKKMNYLYAGAVVAPDGRYYLVDNEGYSYARYVMTSLSWREMFSEEVAQIEEENRRQAEEEARQEEEERQQRLAAYKARCAKWESLMTEIAPYQEEAERLHKQSGWNSKEYKAAERKLHNVRRANILTMCKTAFPGVKFSLKKNSGWGSEWELHWEDGPTDLAFSKETDLRLFTTYHDYFNAYDDSTGVSYEEFTEFAYKYMGSCNSIETVRDMSEEKKAELIAEVVSIVPELEKKNEYGYYKRVVLSNEQMESIKNHFDIICCSIFNKNNDLTAEEIARTIWVCREYTPDAKPLGISTKKPIKNAGINENELHLIDYSEKAVAIIGNTRDYVAELKELGGRFNGKLKCGAGWVFSKKREPELRAAFSL
ncbi:LPD29 domain-containing protein [Phocaeicola plebeius]|uniref:LPD29 domain-containing protein n=1 Tax=Phocaeicola plebeius TaxID=310297 RepID=UPI003FD6E7B3